MSNADEKRSLIILGSVALLSIVGAIFAWHKWGPSVTKDEKYSLQADQLTIPPQPKWIKQDVKADVIRSGSLTGLSALDKALTEKVESAFAVHTWVAKVIRVRKRPGPRVEVELEYRRPVALVEVYNEEGQRALQPVDSQGYVLPTDFLRDDVSSTREYLRIAAGYGMPSGPVGTPWGDARISGGAQVCDALTDSWKSLGLFRIVAAAPASDASDAQYELVTRGNSRIIWGHIPGQEENGEADASAKIKYLKQYVARQGPLDANGPVTLDLRSAVPYTAAVP